MEKSTISASIVRRDGVFVKEIEVCAIADAARPFIIRSKNDSGAGEQIGIDHNSFSAAVKHLEGIVDGWRKDGREVITFSGSLCDIPVVGGSRLTDLMQDLTRYNAVIDNCTIRDKDFVDLQRLGARIENAYKYGYLDRVTGPALQGIYHSTLTRAREELRKRERKIETA